VEASALQAPVGLTRSRISHGAPLLRLRSDEQLVALFRAGHDEAFRIIHDRYRQRLFAYTRQMIPGSRQDAEDALQDVFIKAYGGLRANDRELALRAWLYRVAHNRCIDELRRPPPPSPEVIDLVRSPIQDPIAQAEQRESLRRLIADLRRLPEQQRSALLMRELSGMSYAELSGALGASIPAVKSLLVRARIGLARAQEARDTACSEIRDDLLLAHDRRVRPSAIARRHLRDCAGCREFRSEVRGVSRELGALVPAVGPMAALAKLLGIGGGASGGAAAGSGAACAGGAASTGGILTAGGVLAGGAGHVATLFAAAVVTAGGAVEIQHTMAMPATPQSAVQHVAVPARYPGGAVRTVPGGSPSGSDAASSASTAPTAAAAAASVAPSASRRSRTAGARTSTPAGSTSPAVTVSTGPAGPDSPSVTAGVDAANAGSSSSTATSATGQSAGSTPGASGTGSTTGAPGSGSAPGAAAGLPAAGTPTGAPASTGSSDGGAQGTSSPGAVAGPASGPTGTTGKNASPPPSS
jgi:RNA polymerase sigma factor (sigma-70 family)